MTKDEQRAILREAQRLRGLALGLLPAMTDDDIDFALESEDHRMVHMLKDVVVRTAKARRLLVRHEKKLKELTE